MAEPSIGGALVVAMPAYNEAAGIAEFLRELDEALLKWSGSVRFVVVDDASTDGTREVLASVAPDLSADLDADRNATNRGHGPTVVRAFGRALDAGADYVLQVDGDGQFLGDDVPSLIEAVADGADVAVGVRRHRADPWFRRALSRGLRVYLRVMFGVESRDPNCPFRLYRREVLEDLLVDLPADPMVPTVYLTALAGRRRFDVREVEVTHRSRRGPTAQGSTWGVRQRRVLIPRRLIRFVWRALVESLQFAARARAIDGPRAVARV